MKELLWTIPAWCFTHFRGSSLSQRQDAVLQVKPEAPLSYHPLASSRTRLNYAQEKASLPDSSDPYVILNVQPGADMKDIKRAYRKLVVLHHPDASPENKLKAAENFARLNAAYAYLTGKSDKLPEDPTQKIYKKKQSRPQQTYSSWNHPTTRTDYHVHIKNRGNTSESHNISKNPNTKKTYSYKFDPNRFISEGWYSNYNPERPSQYSSPRPPWDINDAFIRDFATWAQVRDFDVQGNPINGLDSHSNIPYPQQYSYGKSANHDFDAVYAQRQYFDSLNYDLDRSNYSSRSGFRDNDNIRINYEDLVKDFATFAQVRDYDADGKPIDKNGKSHNTQEILYEVVDDRFMREFEEIMKKSQMNMKHNEVQTNMNVPSSYRFDDQVRTHHEQNKSNQQMSSGQMFNSRGSQGSFPPYSSEINMPRSISTHSSWNHEQISSFDMDGNPKGIDFNNYHPQYQSSNMKMPIEEQNHLGYSKVPNRRTTVNTNPVQGYDIHGNPIVRDMSIYVDEVDQSYYSPDPSYVQSYDIHGNVIDRPNTSVKKKKHDSVYNQPGRI